MVDAYPVHFPSSADLLLSDDRDVVFSLTGDRASTATDTRVEIDRHPPRVRRVLVVGIERVLGYFLLLLVAGEIRVASEFSQRRGTHLVVAAMKAHVNLRGGERV